MALLEGQGVIVEGREVNEELVEIFKLASSAGRDRQGVKFFIPNGGWD